MTNTIEVLWHNEHAIAINKPAGLATQSPSPYESVETRLRTQLNREAGYLAFPHRLDRSVSGVLLAALTKRAARLLSGQFESRKTAKRYLAIVEGLCAGEHRWENWLHKVPNQPRVQIGDSETPGAKSALTLVRSLDCDPARNQSTLELSPVTGRMHQLRVQAAAHGHPIVGDIQYGAGNSENVQQRILLHASRLEFHHPGDGKRTVVEAECPFV